jgi:hypothetical protein
VISWWIAAVTLLLGVATGLPARAEEPPSRTKVLGLSLLLPGLGHQALGSKTKAQAFFAGEAVIWGAFGLFKLQGHTRRDRYVEMAEIFAGVPDADGRSSEYYRLLGRYHSSDDYDDEIRRDARARFPDDLAARDAYFQRHRVAADQVWLWESNADWDSYQAKRSESNRSFKRARSMVGIAVANRLLASVDAMRIIHRRHGAGNIGFRLAPDPVDPREPVRFCVDIDLP